jgi:hypothetical protein
MAVIVYDEPGLHSRIVQEKLFLTIDMCKNITKGNKTAVEIKERELGEIHIFWSEKSSRQC